MSSGMSIRLTMSLAFTLLMAMAGQPSLQAQILEMNPRVSVNVGSSFLRGERLFTVDGDAFQSRYDNGFAFGVRGNLDLTKAWGMEAGYALSPNTLHVTKLGNTPEERRFDFRLQRLEANALRYIPLPGLRVFVTGGIGMTRFGPSDAAKVLAATGDFINDPALIDTSSKFSANFGGGIESRVHSRLGIRADVRDHITGVPRFGLNQTASGSGSIFYPVNGSAHDVETSIGLVLYLR